MSLVARAEGFAIAAHGSIDQRRKYTNDPYIVHPKEVAELVMSVRHTPEMLAAAWLHDTVEDVPWVTHEIIRREFGPVVGQYVYYLTDISKLEDGNRATRKGIDRAHISTAPAEVKTIKLADLLSNTSSIVHRDIDFARVYLPEKERLLTVLTEGDPILLAMAMDALGEGYSAVAMVQVMKGLK